MAKVSVGAPHLAQVVAFDPYDAVRLGVTSLPNANAEAAGGLFTRGTGAGQINQDANGRIDTRTAAIVDGVITAAKFAADAITSTVLATSAAQKVRDSLLTYSHDTGVTVEGLFVRLDALLGGKATGLLSTLARFYRRDGVTVAFEANQNVTLGTRATATVTGSE